MSKKIPNIIDILLQMVFDWKMENFHASTFSTARTLKDTLVSLEKAIYFFASVLPHNLVNQKIQLSFTVFCLPTLPCLLLRIGLWRQLSHHLILLSSYHRRPWIYQSYGKIHCNSSFFTTKDRQVYSTKLKSMLAPFQSIMMGLA